MAARERGVMATACCTSNGCSWHMLLDDGLEIQVDAPNITFSFNLLRLGVIEKILDFCDHKRKSVNIGRYGSWWTGVNLELIWDDEFPKTRAFVKGWKSNQHLLMLTLEGDSLVCLRGCAKQLYDEVVSDI